ncbi:hypothetical protein HPB51_029747 [Rhipicephalus microplus]|uniref:Ileal sodium/bile acid cotransporter n=1 Tax=Rhipicephalus microplus TaxID=6941 RepID=A0A9J6CTA6_RHIMP|nr:hypothetical protein HPB51_029747 [Rhipicephalus microplus]
MKTGRALVLQVFILSRVRYSALLKYGLVGVRPANERHESGIAMTLCSTVLAMGMMPANMLIYGNYVDTGDIVVPYSKMAMSLVFISLPAGLGMLFNWFCPRVAPYITKLSSTLGGLLIVVTQIMEVFIFPDIFHNIPPVLYAATVIMPAAGMMLGYLISWLLKRPDAVRKTIAIESGIQNVGMGLTIVSLSFKFQVSNLAVSYISYMRKCEKEYSALESFVISERPHSFSFTVSSMQQAVNLP